MNVLINASLNRFSKMFSALKQEGFVNISPQFYLIVLISLIALSACSQNTVITKSVPVFPPDKLMKECPQADAPTTKYATYGDLVEYSLAQKKALKDCNADKTALRQWKKDLEAEQRVK